jgi:hypothetical protein
MEFRMKTKSIISLALFLFFLVIVNYKPLSAQVLEQDSLALVALYDSTDGTNWTNNENWLNGPVATWSYVTVSNNRVVDISLYRNNLNGSIPTEIGDLDGLRGLHLGENSLTGNIPAEIGNLTDLTTLYLFQNQLEGPITNTIGNLVNLEQFAISSNNLTGEIPSEIGNLTKLVRIQLYRNNLSGTLPKSIGNLTNLVKLQLYENQLTGDIPEEISGMSNLKELLLYDNQFTGPIPLMIGMLDSLEHLNLYKNQLEGTIPKELANLKKLNKLVLAENNFEGAFPSEITTLPNMKEIYIQINMLSELPDLSPIDSLQKLRIQENNLTFEDIEPNVWVPTFTYSPQAFIGKLLDTTIYVGENLILSVDVGGTANVYQWTRDGLNILNATENIYTIDSAEASDNGVYICKITNTIATELTLYSREMNVAVERAVGVEKPENELPTKLALFQNYPNPFNPSTTIKYTIPASIFPSGVKEVNVQVNVYDILGREVARLVNQKQKLGNYEITWEASNQPSGVYFYQLSVGPFLETKKMILLR